MTETKVEEELGNRVKPYFLLCFLFIFFFSSIHLFLKKIWGEAIQLAVYIVKPYILLQNAFKLINRIVMCIRTFISTRQKRTDSLWRKSL